MNHSIVELIDNEINQRSLLKHSFYRMWSEGRLTVDHLQGYSKEYFQLVKSIPKFVENILCLTSSIGESQREQIFQNLREELEHIESWIKFASAIGVSREELLDYIATSTTNGAVSELIQLTESSIEEAVAAMYAYEAELPKISRSKIDGLSMFYDIDSSDARNYFEIHEKADIIHAGVWRKILLSMPLEMEKRAFGAAVQSLKLQNKLLDSIQEKCIGTHC